MQPIIISLQPEYTAELLDPLHRRMELSNQLYLEWATATNNLSTNLDFPAWIEANYNTANRYDMVSYIPADQLANSQVIFNHRRAIIADSKLACENDYRGKPLPIALIIMPNKQLYATSMNTSANHTYRVHHSSLSSGGDVYFAAEAYAKDGIFTSITDKSGHYKPNLRSFVYGLSQMIANGADLSSTQIEVNSYDSTRLCTFHLGDEFVNRYVNLGFDADNFRGTFNSIEEANIAYNDEELEYQPEAIYFIRGQNDLFAITKIDNEITCSSFASQFKRNEENDKETLAERKAQRARQQRVIERDQEEAARVLAAEEERFPLHRLSRERKIEEEQEAQLQALLALTAQRNVVNNTDFGSPVRNKRARHTM